MWNTSPTHKRWSVTNIKLKIEYTKSAINLEGGTTLWNTFNIPFQEFESLEFESNFNFTGRGLIWCNFFLNFQHKNLNFVKLKNPICQLHEIFFQDGRLQKQIRINWLPSTIWFWQISTYQEISWEIPVKFPSQKQFLSWKRSGQDTRSNWCIIQDYLSLFPFLFKMPFFTAVQSDSVHTQITYDFPKIPIFIKTGSFNNRVSDRKTSINISRFSDHGSSENKVFNSKLSAVLHILKYTLNIFMDSVVGKSKQLFQLKMLTHVNIEKYTIYLLTFLKVSTTHTEYCWLTF